MKPKGIILMPEKIGIFRKNRVLRGEFENDKQLEKSRKKCFKAGRKYKFTMMKLRGEIKK